jgi:methylase of polypeptide subunit release factors
MHEYPVPDPENTPTVNPLVNLLSYLWLVPRREYLRRFRFGRSVLERVADLDLVVLPDVFNPVIFRTGKYFAELLRLAELPGKDPDGGETATALDLCCGTGVLGLVAANRGFQVDAVDINPEAVRCSRINAMLNNRESHFTAHFGDLFEAVGGKQYDVITFHPPSFRGEPNSRFELSWRSTDVFERFAAALPDSLKAQGVALVLQTSHGDEPGLLRALLATGLEVKIFARKHFGVEIFTVYQMTHRKE